MTSYLYQVDQRFYASVQRGLSELAAEELANLGATDVAIGGAGIDFTANPESFYRIHYLSRLLTRVYAPLTEFDCSDAKTLYDGARSMIWSNFMAPNHSFAISASGTTDSLRNTMFTSQVVKDAVVDSFVQRNKRRPSVNTQTPDLRFHVLIRPTSALLSLDTANESLHRRGYRQESVPAPLQEPLATAMIRWAEWDGRRPLVDPMCGSGTLLFEALGMASRIPAGYLRKHYGFRRLPDFNALLWQKTRSEADRGIQPLPVGLIEGSDMDRSAVAAAGKNSRSLPFGQRIRLKVAPFDRLGSLENRLIVLNPPFGIRLKPTDDMTDFYRRIGDVLKRQCTGSTAVLYLGDRQYVKHIGLKPTWKRPLTSGGLDGRVVRYDLY